MFVAPTLKGLPPQVIKAFSMLQRFVAPVIILAVSVWIDFNCFFESEEQLSHTESLYSSRGHMYDMYIFSSDFLLTLNLRALRRLSLVQALSDILLTWSVHVHVLEKMRPRRLWLVVSSKMVPFIKREGCWTGFNLPKKIIDKVLLGLNVTSQEFVH